MAIKSSDQITVVDLTDGYSVNLTNDSFTFAGDKDGKIATQQSTTTVIQALRGDEEPTISVDNSQITKPSGVTTSWNANTKTLTITVSISVASGGVVTIPVVLDGSVTINKVFSFAIAKTGATGETGATGRGISSTTIEYQVGSSGTTVPTGTWSSSPVATTAQGQFLWTRTTIHYTSGSDSISYSVAAHGKQGSQGNPGVDAILISITASNGNIFKNNSGSTILTAHVYKAGAEVTGSALTALGTIKWYKDGGSTDVGTGTTLTVNASDVTSKAVYEARLEG